LSPAGPPPPATAAVTEASANDSSLTLPLSLAVACGRRSSQSWSVTECPRLPWTKQGLLSGVWPPAARFWLAGGGGGAGRAIGRLARVVDRSWAAKPDTGPGRVFVVGGEVEVDDVVDGGLRTKDVSRPSASLASSMRDRLSGERGIRRW
jgi:hypothetical protein